MSSLPLSVYKTVFETSPIGDYLLSPDYTVLAVNDAFLKASSRQRADMIGLNLFEVFTENPDDPDDTGVSALRRSLERVKKTGEPDTLALQRYPIRVMTSEGIERYEERYWSAVNTPIHDDEGHLLCISHSTIDVTDLVKLKDEASPHDVSGDRRARLEAGMFTRAQTVQKINRALDAERRRLSHLFDRAPGFVYFTQGANHRIVQANDAFYELVGSRDVIDRPVRIAFPDVVGQGFIELHDAVYRSGERYVGNAERILLQTIDDGPPAERYIDLVYQPITDASGKVVGICGHGQDITERKRLEDELRASEERWKLALETSGGGLWDIELAKDEATYSRLWKSMLGYAEHEIGRTLADWQRLIHPEDLPNFLAALNSHLAGQSRTFASEYRMRCKDSSWKWVLARGAVVKRDEAGEPARIIGTNVDVSQSKRAEQQIWHQAHFDGLTGLPNRRLFRDRLGQEVKKTYRSGQSLALLFIDLDRFKEVNDLLGHDAGDALLTQAANRIVNCVRGSDTVARLGGDEFTVILSSLDMKTHVEDISRAIINALAAPFILGTEIAHVSGSIGITYYPTDAASPEELIRNADQAMYWAKKAGRNQFRFFTRSMQQQAHARLKLSGDLRGALAKDQFEVFYQPVVDLRSRRVSKAEALLRWHHPKLGLVEPSRFIPLAEESGLISEIGDWVFKTAAACSGRWSARMGRPFEISVNKSPVQFMAQSSDLDWPSYLQGLGLPGKSISVEITESMLVDASPKVAETLLQYRDAGIQVAIDDFGTGYSSMAYLKKFDIDYLKIDQSFVRDLASDTGSRTIAKSMIVMAHELGLKVIAEGIETTEQAEILLDDGCDYGQGFLFAKPMPAPEFEWLLERDGLFLN